MIALTCIWALFPGIWCRARAYEVGRLEVCRSRRLFSSPQLLASAQGPRAALFSDFMTKISTHESLAVMPFFVSPDRLHFPHPMEQSQRKTDSERKREGRKAISGDPNKRMNSTKMRPPSESGCKLCKQLFSRRIRGVRVSSRESPPLLHKRRNGAAFFASV